MRWVQETHRLPEAYAQRDEMLDQPPIDAVIVGRPVYCHLDNVLAIASAGKRILCEKPIARTPNQCNQMIDTYRKHNITLMVAFMKRYHKYFLKAKQMIDNDEMGPVFQVRVNWSFLSPPGGWRDSFSTWGGID